MSLLKTLVLGLAVVSLSACASGAKSHNMVPSVPAELAAPASSPYYKNIAINTVTGGKDTNPLWTSQVSSLAFEQALQETLQNAGYYKNNGGFILHADLLSLSQPMFGIELGVTSTVKYDLQSQKTKAIVFSETITATGSAGFSDAALAVERLRVANEKSSHKNLTAFLKTLRKK